MANENDPLFSIDSSVTLAKLHLAAQSQVTQGSVLNTGIKNPVAKADPKNVGNVQFDLSNKSGEYQFAIVRDDFSFYPEIDLTLKPEIGKADEDVKKLKIEFDKAKEEFEKLGGKDTQEETDKTKEDEDKKTSLTDKNADKNSPDPKKLENAKQKLEAAEKPYREAQIKFIDLFKGTVGVWVNKDAQKAADNVKDIVDKEVASQFDKEALEKLHENDINIYNLAYALKIENEARNEQYAKNITTWTTTSYKNGIQPYFDSFCDSENASKIKESDIVPIFLSIEKPVDIVALSKEYISDFKFKTLEKSEFDKQAKDIIIKKPEIAIEPTIGFAVGFTVEVETM